MTIPQIQCIHIHDMYLHGFDNRRVTPHYSLPLLVKAYARASSIQRRCWWYLQSCKPCSISTRLMLRASECEVGQCRILLRPVQDFLLTLRRRKAGRKCLKDYRTTTLEREVNH